MGRTENASRAPQAPLPGVWRVGLARGRVEVKSFLRERQSVVFILAMPAIMLVLLGAIFGKENTAPGVTIGDLYVAGLIGGGVMATSYQNLGMSIAFERERFTLKRLRGTPMQAAAYFMGKIVAPAPSSASPAGPPRSPRRSRRARCPHLASPGKPTGQRRQPERPARPGTPQG